MEMKERDIQSHNDDVLHEMKWKQKKKISQKIITPRFSFLPIFGFFCAY